MTMPTQEKLYDCTGCGERKPKDRFHDNAAMPGLCTDCDKLMRVGDAEASENPGSVQRIVSLRLDKESCLGAWEIICDECPLKPHLDALGMKPKSCAAGIQTNVQGAIPMAQCEHYEKDSIKSEGKTLTLTCRKQDNELRPATASAALVEREGDDE